MSNTYHQGFFAMNTRCHMVFPGIDEDKAAHVFQLLKSETERIEFILSRFIQDSEISKINRSAFNKTVKVSDEVFTILKTCQQYSDVSNGAFDVTLYPLIKYWNGKGALQQQETGVEDVLKNLGMEHVILNGKEQTVSFDNKYIEIDLGGFGKGYALEKMNQLLQKFSVENAFISFGESSVLTIGNHPAGDGWRVGVNNYLDPGNSLHTFRMHNGSMSTSSNFYVDDKGNLQNHQHVINPKTGYPVKECATVSVSAESPVLAEMLSTAILVSSPQTILEINDTFENVEIVRIDYQTGEPQLTVF